MGNKKAVLGLIRVCDVFLSVIGLVITMPVLLLITIGGFLDTGSPIFFQKRVGRDKAIFTLIKFRTMHLDTAQAASHLTGKSSVTKFGSFLRKTKLDELPQLINVLIGDMSLVGPRPCLVNQSELIDERDRLGVFDVRPGITGLAQVNNIDMSEPKLLAKIDAEMVRGYSLPKYFDFIIMTVTGHGQGDRVR